MKKKIILLLIIIGVSSCKKNSNIEKEVILSTTEQIAETAGIKNWDAINEVKFTFSVHKMENELYARNWKWNRRTEDITLINSTDTVRYNRNKPMDSIQASADRAFVNDSYWLIPEFKFLTDKGIEIIEKTNAIAPISKDTLDMFTIIYGVNGGYTPGDAYDVYYDKENNLQEWAYRRQNDTTIGMMTTFEKFNTINGIKVATNHQTPDNNTHIRLTNIEFNK